jgi:5-methylcytosine-specific restriction endonuclease McrBC regulatory subunit McrC
LPGFPFHGTFEKKEESMSDIEELSNIEDIANRRKNARIQYMLDYYGVVTSLCLIMIC